VCPPGKSFDFNYTHTLITSDNTYSFDVFKCITINLGEILGAEVDIPLSEDVATSVVISVFPEFVGQLLGIVEYFRAIKRVKLTDTIA
jgi:hypothetical protein